MSEPLYRKVGRRYVPVAEAELHDYQVMPNGFVLTYRKDGRTQYEYKVQPDNASFVAAAMVARTAMEDRITQTAKCAPNQKNYTKNQLAIISKFREDMGGMFPLWWDGKSARDIAQAGIDAVGAA